MARLNQILSCNLEFSGVVDNPKQIHLFVDSFDESNYDSDQDQNLFEDYKKYFSNNIKILMTCRTGFEINEKIIKDSSVHYIAPIGYGTEDNNNKQAISKWLKENEIENFGLENVLQEIKRLGFQENMKTGLMFDMVLSILTRNDQTLSNFYRLSTYQVYNLVISQEIQKNLDAIYQKSPKKQIRKDN